MFVDFSEDYISFFDLECGFESDIYFVSIFKFDKNNEMLFNFFFFIISFD